MTSKTTSPYDVTVTAQPISESLSASPFEKQTSAPQPPASSKSPVPIPCAYNHRPSYDSDGPPPYSELPPDTCLPDDADDVERTQQEEQERKQGMKAYAAEISRIVGKQLAGVLKGNQKAHAVAIQQNGDVHINALKDARKILDQHAAGVDDMRRDSVTAEESARRAS